MTVYGHFSLEATDKIDTKVLNFLKLNSLSSPPSVKGNFIIFLLLFSLASLLCLQLYPSPSLPSSLPPMVDTLNLAQILHMFNPSFSYLLPFTSFCHIELLAEGGLFGTGRGGTGSNSIPASSGAVVKGVGALEMMVLRELMLLVLYFNQFYPTPTSTTLCTWSQP